MHLKKENSTKQTPTSKNISDANGSVEKESKATASKNGEMHLKKENATKQNPTSNNTYSLNGNKFLKQMASAEQNVKKLLQSSPKKQTNHAQPPVHHLPKAPKQSQSNYKK
jgi:hypothetical protein